MYILNTYTHSTHNKIWKNELVLKAQMHSPFHRKGIQSNVQQNGKWDQNSFDSGKSTVKCNTSTTQLVSSTETQANTLLRIHVEIFFSVYIILASCPKVKC